ncbi:sperm-associated antigen 7 homolog [Aplysia californica]|uniref:Sperm-associated antigen 7 homolog n=1 Tax=Aplysia californica TaxID=6500 RepID=A0ABM0K6X3_APLCA|nr:sperm-associated antigen 7 homolog [Aplysia californica]
MADLLGSILGSMEKPPTMGSDERKKAKAQKAMMEKQQEAEKKKIDAFRTRIQKKIHEFIKDGTLEKLKLEPMEKGMRAIVHEVSEVAGLTSFSFGHEEEDRYVLMWKKEFAPSDEELLAYRRGEEWDPEKAKEMEKLKEIQSKEEEESRKQSLKETPASNYRDKYKHLIGDEAAKDAAREMVSNSSYGFVPATNKRDLRTIEQVLADTRAKKKQKLDPSAESSGSPSASGDQGEGVGAETSEGAGEGEGVLAEAQGETEQS